MNGPQTHEFQIELAGQRLDQLLAERIDGLSRTYAQQLIETGNVRIRGRQVRPSYRVRAGDIVRLLMPAPVLSRLEPETIAFAVVYEDDEMLVVDKPAGIAVHPAPGHRQHTLVHALLARYPNLPGIQGSQRPGIVHRLDLDTSGLLMVAKTDRGQLSLSSQLAARSVKKGYLALCIGRLEPGHGTIDAPVGRDPAHRQRMTVLRGGRDARTRYASVAYLPGHTLVLAMPETGRTHQIRVHLAALGHPIAGDRLYGGESVLLARQFLHAYRLRFARPADGERVECSAGLPDDLKTALGRLLRQAGTLPGVLDQERERLVQLSARVFNRDGRSS